MAYLTMFQVAEIVSYGVQEWSLDNKRERMGKVKVVTLVMLPPQRLPELTVEMPHSPSQKKVACRPRFETRPFWMSLGC